MKGKKTLVILSPAFPENEAATYWVPSQQLMVKSLKKNCPELNIIILTTLYPYHRLKYLWNDIEVISFDGTHQRKLKRIALWRNIWKTLKSISNQHTITGIFSFWCGEFAFIANRFAKKKSLQHYIWICGQDARKLNRWVRFIQPKENQLLAMSYSLVNEFSKNHDIKPKYIVPNAINPQSFPLINSAERDIDILGVGSFEPLKQYDLFTAVVKSLADSLPGLKALHCGIGRDKEKIESLIEKMNLKKNFHLSGGKTQEEILQLMQRTKVFLHTSNYEGFSTVCLEALYAGAHVVSFCYPLDYAVPHWHVVQTKEQMAVKALELLNITNPENNRVLLFSMDDSAKTVLHLLGEETIRKNCNFHTEQSAILHNLE
jgi:glycosyltransferase involved in cell wall biosynthesis